MTPERWKRIKHVFSEALKRDGDERGAYLDETCVADSDLRQEVESLLRGRDDVTELRSPMERDDWTGRTISHYRIVEELGEGGMGVVYKAEDTKLHRTIALKFIRPEAVNSAELKARFVHEAEAAAALNHPNICVVHEIDEADGDAFIAMEYVEGESLAAKIKKRPLPLAEALDIAAQVAEGLQAAHEKGIDHRDIKPANVMLDAKGRAKIMDFGLAHLEEATRITKTGSSIGTPAYMSPEQVRGEKLDHRTDIWSLGVVIYEMVSGRLPFPGDVPEAVSHAVLHESPEPLTALRAGVPIELDWIVGKCLAKEAGQRYQHADDLRVDLNGLHRKLESGSATVVTTPLPTPATVTEKRRPSYAVPILIALLAICLATALALWFRSPMQKVSVRRFAYSAAPNIAEPVISPDGQNIAFTSGGKLWVLDLKTGEPRVLEDTDGARNPFWSPDGQKIAYATNAEIRQVSLTGGRPIRLCQRQPGSYHGASFSVTGDSLLYVSFAGGLQVCESITGANQPSSLRALEKFENPRRPNAPQLIPAGSDRQALLFYSEGRILVHDLESGETSVIGTGVFPFYSSNGHILYQPSPIEPGIWALPFSNESLEVTGEAFPVAAWGIRPSVARDGTLVFLDSGPPRPMQLVWRDRDGSILETIGQPQQHMDRIALSPDEGRVAVEGAEGDNVDIWVHEVRRRVKTRLTTESRAELCPVWSPAGDQIAFSTMDRGPFLVATDRASEPRALLGGKAGWVDDWSPDGKKMLLGATTALSYVELGNEDEALELVQILPFWAPAPRFSPDGRFVAYHSGESGRNEVAVCEFPGGGNRQQVSTEGGRSPQWSRDGKELFYLDDDWALMAVPVTTTPNFRMTGATEKLFTLAGRGQGVYDVSADGQRFVVAEPVGEAPPPVIRVVQNWAAEFEGRK